jgi:hypothetical protein
MTQVFPIGNTYFSQTTATARNATASSANKIFADGERSPFRMRETVDFATPALRATSFCPSFVFRIARFIAAILFCNSPMPRTLPRGSSVDKWEQGGQISQRPLGHSA